MNRIAISLLVTALSVGMTPALEAQEVLGRVVDEASGEGIRGALVVLHPNFDARVDTTITRADGSYVFESVAPGRYLMEVRHVAYGSQFGDLFTVGPGEGESVVLDFHLTSAVVPLDEVGVEADRPLPHMQRGGYYERRGTGAGRIIEREDIERQRPRTLSDILRRVPGLIAVDGDVQVSRYRGRGCWPTIVIDDTPYRMYGQRGAYTVDGLVMPEVVEAIEVYTRASGLPSRYGGRNSPCGAILIWTRRSLR